MPYTTESTVSSVFGQRRDRNVTPAYSAQQDKEAASHALAKKICGVAFSPNLYGSE